MQEEGTLKLSDEERGILLAKHRAEFDETQALGQRLLETIELRLPDLEVLTEASSHGHGEDGFYRFYHQSIKAYYLQADTKKVVSALQSLMPEHALHPWFKQIIGEGTGKTFEFGQNGPWLSAARPILEGFFHARMMLEYAIKYGRELQAAPTMLPSGWAAVLYLFELR